MIFFLKNHLLTIDFLPIVNDLHLVGGPRQELEQGARRPQSSNSYIFIHLFNNVQQFASLLREDFSFK